MHLSLNCMLVSSPFVIIGNRVYRTHLYYNKKLMDILKEKRKHTFECFYYIDTLGYMGIISKYCASTDPLRVNLVTSIKTNNSN